MKNILAHVARQSWRPSHILQAPEPCRLRRQQDAQRFLRCTSFGGSANRLWPPSPQPLPQADRGKDSDAEIRVSRSRRTRSLCFVCPVRKGPGSPLCGPIGSVPPGGLPAGAPASGFQIVGGSDLAATVKWRGAPYMSEGHSAGREARTGDRVSSSLGGAGAETSTRFACSNGGTSGTGGAAGPTHWVERPPEALAFRRAMDAQRALRMAQQKRDSAVLSEREEVFNEGLEKKAVQAATERGAFFYPASSRFPWITSVIALLIGGNFFYVRAEMTSLKSCRTEDEVEKRVERLSTTIDRFALRGEDLEKHVSDFAERSRGAGLSAITSATLDLTWGVLSPSLHLGDDSVPSMLTKVGCLVLSGTFLERLMGPALLGGLFFISTAITNLCVALAYRTLSTLRNKPIAGPPEKPDGVPLPPTPKQESPSALGSSVSLDKGLLNSSVVCGTTGGTAFFSAVCATLFPNCSILRGMPLSTAVLVSPFLVVVVLGLRDTLSHSALDCLLGRATLNSGQSPVCQAGGKPQEDNWRSALLKARLTAYAYEAAIEGQKHSGFNDTRALRRRLLESQEAATQTERFIRESDPLDLSYVADACGIVLAMVPFLLLRRFAKCLRAG